MRSTRTLIAAAITALALAGCASTSTSPPAAGAGSPSAFGVTGAGPTSSVDTDTPPPPAPTAEPSSGPCTSKACIAQDAQGMVGTVAKDNSVLTKMKCRKSTVKRPTPGVYTVHCTATYSDGSVWSGIASVLLAQGKVEWQATGEISEGAAG